MMGTIGIRIVGGIPVGYKDPSGNQRDPGYYNGVWYYDPDAAEFGASSDTYKIINDCGNLWSSTSDIVARGRLHGIAEEARRFAREGIPYTYGVGLSIFGLRNVPNDSNISLDKKWSYRYEMKDPNRIGDKAHMHLFQPKGKQDYSQNDDGSDHHPPEGGSGPPNSVKKALKEKTDWDSNDRSFLNQIRVVSHFNGAVKVTYPDRRVGYIYPTAYEYYNCMSASYTAQDLRNLYFYAQSPSTFPTGPYVIPVNPYMPLPSSVPHLVFA